MNVLKLPCFNYYNLLDTKLVLMEIWTTDT